MKVSAVVLSWCCETPYRFMIFPCPVVLSITRSNSNRNQSAEDPSFAVTHKTSVLEGDAAVSR